MNDELRKVWKEAVMTYFKGLTLHFPEGTERNHEKLSRDSHPTYRLRIKIYVEVVLLPIHIYSISTIISCLSFLSHWEQSKLFHDSSLT